MWSFLEKAEGLEEMSFKYGETELEIVSKYTYLGIVFTSGGSFNSAQSTLSDQAKELHSF